MKLFTLPHSKARTSTILDGIKIARGVAESVTQAHHGLVETALEILPHRFRPATVYAAVPRA